MAVKLAHQTQAQFLARLRARYRAATGDEAVRIAAWLAAHEGDFTAAEWRVAFGVTAAGLTAAMNRARALASARVAIMGARGE